MNSAWIAIVMATLAAEPVIFIAHRGESADAPENTLAAFRLAWERKVTAIELDVHLTKDGRLAVCHDFDTKRTTGVMRELRQSNWDELKDLDAGRLTDPKFTGEKLPLLDDVLATIPEGCRCFIEVKVGPEAVPALVQAVEKCGKRPEQLAVISFKADTVAEAKRCMPQLKVYYLSGFKRSRGDEPWSPSIDELIKKAQDIKADGLDLSFRGPLDEATARRIREAKLELYAWTVNDADLARDLVRWGVNGITTDKAAWLRDELRKDSPSE